MNNNELEEAQFMINEAFQKSLFGKVYRAALNPNIRLLTIFAVDPPHILEQQQFTKNEWTIFIKLIISYPHYTSYEVLLSSITLLSCIDCRKKIHEAELLGSYYLKRELKSVHRALSGIRAKLKKSCPYLKISLIRDTGYALTTASSTEIENYEIGS